jgi:hypothetical protein
MKRYGATGWWVNGVFILPVYHLWQPVNVCFVTHGLPVTFAGQALVAIFSTHADAANQTLISYEGVCGALNRSFCLTRVSGSGTASLLLFILCFLILLCQYLL